MGLSAQDYATIRTLRAAGVLKDVDQGQLRKERFVAVACADGDRFPELFKFHSDCCGEGACFHMQTRNGGGLVLADSPLGRRGGFSHRSSFIYEIEESCDIKKTNVVKIYAHFPCAAATLYNISAQQAFDLLIQAKDTVRAHVRDSEVTLLVHIDYEGYHSERFKTYYFDRKAYEASKQNASDLSKTA